MALKRPFPDAVQHTVTTDSLVSHVVSYLDVEDLVRIRSVSKTFRRAVAQPATWAHTTWQPAPKYKSQLAHILQHCIPHLHTLVLSHLIWMSDTLDVASLNRLPNVQLILDCSDWWKDRCSDDHQAMVLQQVRQHKVNVTRLNIGSDGFFSTRDPVLDAMVDIPTLQTVKLCTTWRTDGLQIDKYVPVLAAKHCEIHMLDPGRSGHDCYDGQQAVLIHLAALRQAHHYTTLVLSWLDPGVYHTYLDWFNSTPSEQLLAPTSSKLQHFKLSVCEDELVEAQEAEVVDKDADNFDCNYNDWMHVFLSQHRNLQSVEIDSPDFKWRMTDALCSQLCRMPRLRRLRFVRCVMSQPQRSALQALGVDLDAAEEDDDDSVEEDEQSGEEDAED